MTTHREKRLEFLNTQLGWKVGQAIRKYKKDFYYTNEGLADLFDCNSATVSKWCKDNRDMRLDSFLTVVRALELDLKDLLKDTEWEGIL